MRAFAWTAALLWVAGCEQDISIIQKVQAPAEPDSDSPVTTPMIMVEPNAVSFGEVEVGEVGSAVIKITNIGDAELDITGITLKGDPAFTSPDVGLNANLDPGESREIEVLFVAAEGDADADLTVLSSDPATPEVAVPLDAFAALKMIYGEALDFGYVRIGQWNTLPLRIHNDGNLPVTLEEIRSTDTHFVPYLTGPVVIDPGAVTEVDVTFTPDDLIVFSGELRLVADTPTRPEEVPVTGSGAEGPVAICSADPPQVDAITGSFRFKGDQSFDPTGRPITASWTWVSLPPGSQVGNALRGLNTGLIHPDVVGDYTARLVVTNDLGYSSAPCTATATANPGSGLWVEMFWQYRGDDMDLHLLRNNGNMNSGNDCYYGNCVGGLGWDAAGRADDPSLDLDDIPGRGPENINIDAPAANTYTVVVHDYPGSVYNGANEVTINVYVGGTLMFQDTRSISGERREVRFVQIDYNQNPPVLTPL